MKNLTLLVSFLLIISSLIAQEPYLKNNFGFRPLTTNNNGLGIGLQYERYLDSTNNFSVYLPIDYLIITNSNYNHYGNINESGFSFSPSFRIYFKEPQKFNWFLGVGFYYGNSSHTNDDLERTENTFGNMINFGFKATVKNKVTFGLDLGTGIAFKNKIKTTYYQSNIWPTEDNKIKAIGAINFQLGYNF
jgi:hypothetical protein